MHQVRPAEQGSRCRFYMYLHVAALHVHGQTLNLSQPQKITVVIASEGCSEVLRVPLGSLLSVFADKRVLRFRIRP